MRSSLGRDTVFNMLIWMWIPFRLPSLVLQFHLIFGSGLLFLCNVLPIYGNLHASIYIPEGPILEQLSHKQLRSPGDRERESRLNDMPAHGFRTIPLTDPGIPVFIPQNKKCY